MSAEIFLIAPTDTPSDQLVAALTAALELQRRGVRRALVTMCIGVGQGVAMLLEEA